MKPQQKDNAQTQGQAQFDSIMEMVQELTKAHDSGNDQAIESAQTRIHEDALSVEVRSDWYDPCSQTKAHLVAAREPAEFRILLCTGGPACQIRGTLSEHGEPASAQLEVQDWGTPWTPMRPLVNPGNYDSEPILLTYARTFYFGE